MNVSRDRKVKTLAYLPEYWLDLAQIWCRGYFWILNPKSTKLFLYDVILKSKWREGRIPIYRLHKMHMTSLWRHLLFNFLKTSIFLLLIRDYQHTKFGLIWVKESKVMEGGRSAPLQVENVLNRPGEIGLRWGSLQLCQSSVNGLYISVSYNSKTMFSKNKQQIF